jgi:LTXXQ motif family protein
VRRTLLAAALAATAVVALPLVAGSAEVLTAQNAQPGAVGGAAGDAGGAATPMMPAGGQGMHGGPMMMHHRMMMRGDPQERCIDRLARRAARRAYVETKLDLTAAQRSLWDKLQAIALTEEQKERQLCAGLKAATAPNLLDRMERLQQFLAARLDGLQTAKPALQAFYQALTPAQRAILDAPPHRS